MSAFQGPTSDDTVTTGGWLRNENLMNDELFSKLCALRQRVASEFSSVEQYLNDSTTEHTAFLNHVESLHARSDDVAIDVDSIDDDVDIDVEQQPLIARQSISIC